MGNATHLGLDVHKEIARTLEAAREAGRVTPIPLHGARHSYAEIALSAGVRLDVVSRSLGHSSSSFTADQYSHDSDAAAPEAAERIGAVLSEQASSP